MANKQIGIVFGVKGGGNINGESGQLIRGQLESIAKQFSHNPQLRNVLIFGLNKQQTKNQITRQLDSIIADIKKNYKNGLSLDVSLNGQKLGNGGSGGRGSGVSSATALWNKLDTYMHRNAQGMPDSLQAQFIALGDAIKKDGADVADLGHQFELLQVKAEKAAAEMKADTAAGVAAEKEAAAEKRRIQKENDAEIRRAAKQSALENKAQDLSNKYGDLLRKFDPDKYKQLTGLLDRFQSGKLSDEELRKIGIEINNIAAAAKKAENPLNNMWEGFKNHLAHAAYAAALMVLRKAIREVYNNVVELDKAVTDLQVASGKTRAEVQAMVKDYSKLAQELGTTTAKVAEGADTWLRQGYAGAEANILLSDSTKLAVLGQMESKEAATALTSAMKGYKVEVNDAIGIVDKFTAVDMKAAASAGDIATAMSETAVSANVAGVSMDKLIGYLTVVKEVTQDGAESVGTFYKTLFARMGNIKAGKYVSDDGDNLNDSEKVLKKNGIALRDNANQFRNFGDVLDEVASKWETYDNVTQHAIATAFSGTRQQEKFFVLMENYGKALEYEAVAAESAGTANKKYTDAYLDSIEARKNAMTAAFESLSQTILNSNVVKTFFDVVTKIITLVDKFLNTGTGKFVTMLGIIKLITVAVTKIPQLFSTIRTVIQGVTSALSLARTGTDTLTASTTALSSAWQGVFAIIGLVAAAITAMISQYKQLEQEKIQSNSQYLEEYEESAKTAVQLSKLYDQYKKLSPTSNEFKEIEQQIVSLLGDNARILEDLTPGTKQYGDALKYAVGQAEELIDSEVVLADAERRARENLDKSENTYYIKSERLTIDTESGKRRREILENAGFDGYDLYSVTKTSNVKTAEDKIQRYALLRQMYAAFEAEYNRLKSEGNWSAVKELEDDELFQILSGIAKGRNPGSGYEEINTLLKATTRRFVKQFKDEIDAAADDQELANILYNKIIPAVSDKYGVKSGIYDYEIRNAYESAIGRTLNLVEANIDDVDKYIESFYDTLSGSEAASALKSTAENITKVAKAIEEMDGSGKISLETAQSLVELGEEYTDAITVENGELKLNTSLLRQMSVAQLEAARTAAINNNAAEETIALYDAMIRSARQLGLGNSLDRHLKLLDYENTIFEFSGSGYNSNRMNNLNRAQERILNTIAQYRRQGKSSDSEEIMSLYQQYISYAEKLISLKKEDLSEAESDYKDSIEKENDALEEQKKLLDDIIDARKKALEIMKNERSYQDQLNNKNKTVADLEMRLATSRLDTSAAGRANTRKLEDELAKARKDLDDFNFDHAVDVISDKLDAERDENERIYNQQKAENDARLDRLITSNKQLLDNYEEAIKSKIDLVDEALDGLNLYGENSVYGEIQSIEGILEDIELLLSEDEERDKKNQMKALSNELGIVYQPLKDMASQLASERQGQMGWSNAQRNKYYDIKLAELMADPSIINDPVRLKEWSRYVPVFHSGGTVGNLNLGENEVFAKLMKGEFVSTPAQMSNFLNKTLPAMTNGTNINAPLISMQVESVTKDSLPQLETIIKRAADKIKSELSSGFSKTGFRASNKRILSTQST